MDRIDELSDDLLIKVLTFVPTKVAVSTRILSKRWGFLWMWVPKLEYNDNKDIIYLCRLESPYLRYRDFINKNLPLHRAPIIESLRLSFCSASFQPEDIKLWLGIAISRFVRELELCVGYDVVLPCSLYTCKSLVALKLEGRKIIVDVPPTVCLPSLKTLQLLLVTYFNEDCLGLLLSCCPVLEDLVIERHRDDNVKTLVVILPSLQKLSLCTYNRCFSGVYVMDTPSLKYFKVEDDRVIFSSSSRDSFSYSIKHMPKLEEADIAVWEDLKEFLEPITTVKRLSLILNFDTEEDSMYRSGIVFDQLEHLELSIFSDYWSNLLVGLLNNSPKLRVLNLSVYISWSREQVSLSNEQSLIPECLLKSLETFEFAGYKGRPEERAFLSFILKNARCLKSPPILCPTRET